MKTEMTPNYERLENLLQEVASACGVTPADLKGNSRENKYTIPRQVFCYAANRYFGEHVTRIAAIINKNRTTVIHSVSVIEGLLDVNDAETLRIINQIKRYENEI